MQLKIKRSQVGKRYQLDLRAEYAPAERGRVVALGKYYDIYRVHNSFDLKDITKRKNVLVSIIGGMFPEIRSDAIAITALSLEHGHTLEARSLETITHAEVAIRKACEKLQTKIDVADLYKGQEQVIDFTSAKPEVIARATPLADDAP